MNVEMTIDAFITYLRDTFNITNDALLIILNILRYADDMGKTERKDFLKEMLVGTFGITEGEIDMYVHFHVEG